jgi:putative exporter of polyketide antibiotics
LVGSKTCKVCYLFGAVKFPKLWVVSGQFVAFLGLLSRLVEVLALLLIYIVFIILGQFGISGQILENKSA